MKNFLMIGLCAFSLVSMGQTTISSQPNACYGIDAMIRTLVGNATVANTNYGTYQEMVGHAWTISGNNVTSRCLIDFEILHCIPENAIITNASLEFFGRTMAEGSSTTVAGNSGTLSPCNLNRVTSSWTESGVTWNTQPTFTTTNQVSVPGTALTWGYDVNLNVTALVQDMVNLPSASRHGFLLMLANETRYRSLLFSSSDNPNTAHAPRITVTYEIECLPIEEPETKGAQGGSETVLVSDILPVDKGFNSVYLDKNKDIQFTIENAYTGAVSYALFNVSGQKTLSGTLNKNSIEYSASIPATNLTSGIYILQVISGDKTASTKVLVE